MVLFCDILSHIFYIYLISILIVFLSKILINTYSLIFRYWMSFNYLIPYKFFSFFHRETMLKSNLHQIKIITFSLKIQY